MAFELVIYLFNKKYYLQNLVFSNLKLLLAYIFMIRIERQAYIKYVYVCVMK